MNIVVLDGLAANPGDLSWEPLKELGHCVVYDRTAPDELLQRAAGAEALLTNKTVLTATDMEQLPDLRYIGVLATGYNVVDIEAARQRGIVVTNIPAYSTSSVAQMVFAHLLYITQRVGHYACENHGGRWVRSLDFCYWDTPLIELAGKRMGIVGLGNTGMAAARIALAMGMEVVAYTSKSASDLPHGIRPCTMDELFSTSDVVSLHCPLTEDTRELVNAARLSTMKPTAILINTGRGPLVNEADLAEALNTGTIMAAGLDVLAQEPPREDNPLFGARNCFITPHIAWATVEARTRLLSQAVENLRSYMAGTPINNVAQ
ncbi:MAG: D-2-hydroxyacid dehydrogenase [Bacteroidaceae bacterium]|nr:D-2-hydroxyacid dehydrogenase [Bacteroidaceae bacterium]